MAPEYRLDRPQRMLTAADALRTAGRRRPPPSLTHLYHEYVMQRIEAFKNSVTRDELMRLAGEATAGLYESDESQLVLTELLTGEVVDQLIRKRLKLKTQKKFGQHILKLRAAQKEPTHWGLDGVCPVVPLLPRLVPTDRALGGGRRRRGVRLPPDGARRGRGVLGLRPRRGGAAGAAHWRPSHWRHASSPRWCSSATGCPPCTDPVRPGGRRPRCAGRSSTAPPGSTPSGPCSHRPIPTVSTCCCRRPPWYPRRSSRSTTAGIARKRPAGERGPRPAGCVLVKPSPTEHRQAAGA